MINCEKVKVGDQLRYHDVIENATVSDIITVTKVYNLGVAGVGVVGTAYSFIGLTKLFPLE